jgi:AraC family transcriptional regulator of adaptative response / methylphosphotriester-DNA alkyltransferase methyltransferase
MQRLHTQSSRLGVYRDAVAIVEAEYADDLTVEALAHRVATSRRQLQRVYAEIGQTTFREHLADIRMRRAAELLATKPMSVREIAARVGYRQPAHFAKAFHRHHGVNPSALRSRGARRGP